MAPTVSPKVSLLPQDETSLNCRREVAPATLQKKFLHIAPDAEEPTKP